MAKLLARRSLTKRFDAVLQRIGAEAPTILDLGCGIGALTTRLAEKFPSSLIVGVDQSKHLLRKLHRKGIALTVLADIQNLPLKDDCFDVAVAMQVLHEILSSKGTDVLIQTLKNVSRSLRRGSELIIFDHVNPGNNPVLIKLSKEMLAKFREFQRKFKYRKITNQDHNYGLISVSLRDLYDFITKIWALNSDLEDEEMHETHTPFTRQEIKDFLVEAGFKVKQISSFTPVHPRKGITLQSKAKLPDRQIILVARK